MTVVSRGWANLRPNITEQKVGLSMYGGMVVMISNTASDYSRHFLFEQQTNRMALNEKHQKTPRKVQKVLHRMHCQSTPRTWIFGDVVIRVNVFEQPASGIDFFPSLAAPT